MPEVITILALMVSPLTDGDQNNAATAQAGHDCHK
jgi:hypothetical protein